MLEGLEGIDWGSLHHAYGAASDVPGLLRALASPRRKKRSRAIYDLYGNIWHQGTVYEATAYAVPWTEGEPMQFVCQALARQRSLVFLPVLIDELRCRPVGLLAADCLAEIGPPAAAAVHRLREISSAEGGVSDGGAVDEIVEREEEFLRAVETALQSVQPS